jgi:putative methyltransferase (TIGR04325 family)
LLTPARPAYLKHYMLLRLIQFYRHLTNLNFGWFGNYPSWQQAKAVTAGYDADNILQRVKDSTLKVKNGEAVYERDAMLFDKVEYSWPLLANLLSIAIEKNNTLSVADFGGSLGTAFFQNRLYLQKLNKLSWSVIEQAQYVTAGRKEIAGNGLDFYYTIDEAIKEKGMPDVLLLGSVLPYLEDPYAMIKSLCEKNIPYIIVENTYFNDRPGDRLTVQKVPPIYYNASYPAWFLDYEQVKKAFQPHYAITTEYMNEQALYFYGRRISYQGFVAKLK